MSNYRIVYENGDGIAIVSPAPGVSQDQALLSVPQGVPYLVVDAADIPTDRTFRNAWQADFSNAQVKE